MLVRTTQALVKLELKPPPLWMRILLSIECKDHCAGNDPVHLRHCVELCTKPALERLFKLGRKSPALPQGASRDP